MRLFLKEVKKMNDEYLLNVLTGANVLPRYNELLALKNEAFNPYFLEMATDGAFELTKSIGAQMTLEAAKNNGDTAKIVDANERFKDAMTAVKTALDDLAWLANE